MGVVLNKARFPIIKGRSQDQFASFIEDYETMADTTALYKEGEKLREEGKYADAVEKFKEILAEKPDHIYAHTALAVTYGNLNQFAEACEHAEKVCELEPSDPFNFTALSVTYQKAFEATRDPIFIQKAEQAKARSDMARGGM